MDRFHPTLNYFSRRVSSFFDEHLAEFGLAVSYVELLMMVKAEGSCTQKQIAEYLGLAPSTITRFVDKLATQGYLKKEKEGREAVIKLTQKGVDDVRKMEAVYVQAENELQKLFGEQYINTTGKLLSFGIEKLKPE